MNFVRCRSTDDVAAEVSIRMLGALSRQPELRLCLPSGMTPIPAYSRMVAAVRDGTASFSRAEVFLLDEFGGVAADASGRCDVMLRRTLLDGIDLPRSRYHRPVPEADDVDAMCHAYDRVIDGRLDLTMLGLGTNGHIGMNEPGSAADSGTRRVELADETIRASARYFDSGPLPTWGVTIGLGPLLASRTVLLVATGASKADIVRAIVHDPVSLDRPASLLRHHPDAWLIADEQATDGSG